MNSEAAEKAAKPAPGKYTKPQEDARRYVEQHSLERSLAQILNGVVQARPAKPRVWMIKFLAERCSPQELQEAGISVKGLHKSQVLRPASPQADGRRDSASDRSPSKDSPAKAASEQAAEAAEAGGSSGRKANRQAQDEADGERPQELNRSSSKESQASQVKLPEQDDQAKTADEAEEEELGSADHGKKAVQISDLEETRADPATPEALEAPSHVPEATPSPSSDLEAGAEGGSGAGSSQPRAADPEVAAESARKSIVGAILQTPDRGVADEGGRELEGPTRGLVTEAQLPARKGVPEWQLRTAFDEADVDGVLFLNQESAEEVRVSLGLPEGAFGDPEGWQDERISVDQMMAALRERELLLVEKAASMASEGAAASQPTPQTAEADDGDEGC